MKYSTHIWQHRSIKRESYIPDMEARIAKLERILAESVAEGDTVPVPRNKRYFNFMNIARDYEIELDPPVWRSSKLCVITGRCDGENFAINRALSDPESAEHTLYFKVQYSDTKFYLTVGLDDAQPIEYPHFTGTISALNFSI